MEAHRTYRREKRTIDLLKTNYYALLVLIPTSLVYGVPFFALWWPHYRPEILIEALQSLNPTQWALLPVVIVGVLLVGVVLHELIHGLTWAAFAPHGFRDIRFGVLWKYVAPYCHCREPMRVQPYILGALMPAVVLGLLPALVSIAIGHLGLLLFGIFFTMAAVGDFMVVELVRREPPGTLVQDHPSEAGCFVFYPEKS